MTLTPREAAYVAGRDLRDVQRAVDKGVVEKRTRTVQGRRTRVFGRSELRFFGALQGHEDTLTPAGRLQLYKAVQRPRSGKAALGPFVVDVEQVDRQIDRGLARLEQVKSQVEPGNGDGPVLKGTSVPIHLLAALAEDGGVDAAARAYPSLPRAAVEAAVTYAQVYPKKGRPYPKQSLKRMMGALALPDEVFADDQEDEYAGASGPREVAL